MKWVDFTVYQRGMSLTEVLIAVSVLSILAALVIPRLTGLQENAEAVAAGKSMKAVAKAAQHYFLTHGEWPRDKNRRVVPPELKPYLPSDDFLDAPLGGVFDYEDWRGGRNTAGGDRIGIAVSIVEGDPDLYDDVDRAVDDGDLATGSIRYCETASRLVYVLVWD